MRYALTLASALLVVVACQQRPTDEARNAPDQSTASPTTMTSTMNPPLAPEKDEPQSRSPAAPTMQNVTLLEYQIQMPQSVPAGHVTFHIENAGKEDHAFVLEGNGVQQQTPVLKRGDSTTLEADLKPGTYTVFCPVSDHKDEGMKMTLTVK